ncbi:MAG: hypothetical protein ACF8NJ_09300 [Phycisphaerales bacterium JB038]
MKPTRALLIVCGAMLCAGCAPAQRSEEAREFAAVTKELCERQMQLIQLRDDSAPETVFYWARRLCLIEVWAAVNREDAVAAVERYLASTEAYLREVEGLRRQGRRSQTDVDSLLYLQAEAALWLAEAQQGQPLTVLADPPRF